MYSNARCKLNSIWRIPPTHPWYKGTSPGSLLEIKCDRGSQTALARLTRGYLKCPFFESGRKIHPTCKKCCDHPTSLDHILRPIGLSKGDLTSYSLIIIDFFGAQQPSGADPAYHSGMLSE
ncbi:RNase H domain-containing protein [Trichonephila clavipes]|nr:RNase H domain-containing protein [Trichonephila clavipes]